MCIFSDISRNFIYQIYLLGNNIDLNKLYRKMEVVSLIFTESCVYGDFKWMLQQPQFNDALFLFNENVESFYNGYKKSGKGNAVIRPYRYTNPVRALPIQTGYIGVNEEGWRGGFRRLDNMTKEIIDEAFNSIEEEIRLRNIKRVFYSGDSKGRLGTNLFRVNEEVIDYIMYRIVWLKC